MDRYDLLVYKVRRPICIKLNVSYKLRDVLLEGSERDMGRGVKIVLFIGDVLNGFSHIQ